MNKNNFFFVLGAPDHEMVEIEHLCKEFGFSYAYATYQGKTVHTYEAYNANGVSTKTIPEDSQIVFVECQVFGLKESFRIDHHHPGDPGYGKQPEKFLEGSSIGQFLSMTQIPVSQRHKIIAACDHCLTAAYQGLCPGVSVEEVLNFRENSRSVARGLTIDELRAQIKIAIDALRAADKVLLNGVPVAWIDKDIPELSEASARCAIPYMYMRKQEDGRLKAGIRSAPSHMVEYWIENCDLNNVYGDPQRGFAAGYFK